MTTATAMTNSNGALNTMVWCEKDIDGAVNQYNNDSAMNGWVKTDLVNTLKCGQKVNYTLKGFGCKRVVIWEPINQANELYVRRTEVVIK